MLEAGVSVLEALRVLGSMRGALNEAGWVSIGTTG